MKLAVITDVHLGYSNSSDIFLNSQLAFFREFKDYLTKNNIDTILFLGDWFHYRNAINVRILNETYYILSDLFKDFKWYMCVGNHDQFYKNSNETHSLKPFKELSNVTVIEDIEKINFDGLDILLVSWQPDKEEFFKKVNDKNLNCEYCFGHFEISSFSFNNHIVCEDGTDPELFFNQFKLTFSGHFHNRTKKVKNGNVIQYIGNPYQLDRGDINKEKGFVVFDTDTKDYIFVENEKSSKYIKIEYPNVPTEHEIQNNIIDVYIGDDYIHQEDKIEEYIKNIELLNPAIKPNVKIVERNKEIIEESLESQNMKDMIKEYIDKLEIENKDKILDKIYQLYDEYNVVI